jgi:hypothetical protein
MEGAVNKRWFAVIFCLVVLGAVVVYLYMAVGRQ